LRFLHTSDRYTKNPSGLRAIRRQSVNGKLQAEL